MRKGFNIPNKGEAFHWDEKEGLVLIPWKYKVYLIMQRLNFHWGDPLYWVCE